MNAKISVFVIHVKTITYLLLHNLHDYILKTKDLRHSGNIRKISNLGNTELSAQSPFQKLNFPPKNF